LFPIPLALDLKASNLKKNRRIGVLRFHPRSLLQPTTDEADLDWMMSLDLEICAGRQGLVMVNILNEKGIDDQETAEGNEGDDV